jgi:hypothetical protein
VHELVSAEVGKEGGTQKQRPDTYTDVDNVHATFGRTKRHQPRPQAHGKERIEEKDLENFPQVMSSPQPGT